MMSELELLIPVQGFDWDDGNRHKNKSKHDVSWEECEQIFFNDHYNNFDGSHTEMKDEERYFTLGSTHSGRGLFVVWTIRRNKVRVISARDMSKKERFLYDQLQKNSEI